MVKCEGESFVRDTKSQVCVFCPRLTMVSSDGNERILNVFTTKKLQFQVVCVITVLILCVHVFKCLYFVVVDPRLGLTI